MKMLRTARIVLSLLFLAASAGWLLTSPESPPDLAIAEKSQIVPSALASCMGVTLFWIVVTLLFGRVYCSTVCPLGTLQDLFIRLAQRVRLKRKPNGLKGTFSYHPSRAVRYHILAIYVVCLLAGVLAVPYWFEPWNTVRNICSVVNPSAVEATWIELGVGLGAGIASGILEGILIALCAIFTGRGYCTAICPIGTALGCLHTHALFHIEIDPDKCTACMECEAVCKSQCVKVVGRYVDNSRCVRCFDCLAACPNNAIRFQPNRNRRGTPLLKSVRNA